MLSLRASTAFSQQHNTYLASHIGAQLSPARALRLAGRPTWQGLQRGQPPAVCAATQPASGSGSGKANKMTRRKPKPSQPEAAGSPATQPEAELAGLSDEQQQRLDRIAEGLNSRLAALLGEEEQQGEELDLGDLDEWLDEEALGDSQTAADQQQQEQQQQAAGSATESSKRSGKRSR